MSLDELRNTHAGETAWIVGKGPSLRFLRREHFGPGPVIALNDAIITVQKLGLPNPIYSLQKDGNPRHMVEPLAEIPLILQDTPGYSRDWFPEHPRRILVDPIRDMGFHRPTIVAVRMAIYIARFMMGCDKIQMVSCDYLVTGALETYDPRTGGAKVTGAARFYRSSKKLVLKDLKSIRHDFIVPRADAK